MPGHGEKLSRMQERAISALLTKPTVKKAAAAIEIDERTLRGWLKDKDFADEYRKARRRVLDGTISGLIRLSRQVPTVLAKLLKSEDEGTRLRTCQTILSHVNSLETAELAAEIEQIKRDIEERRQ